MTKLSNHQLIVLSKAAERADGAGEIPDGIKGAAAARLGTSLVTQKLMREVRAKPGVPVWRKDEKDRDVSLVILKAGRVAVQSKPRDAADPESNKQAPNVSKASSENGTKEGATGTSAIQRSGSKQATVIQMLSRETGATLDALVEATGWLPHSTRAALTGLRKRGYSIERAHEPNLGSVYRIPSRTAA